MKMIESPSESYGVEMLPWTVTYPVVESFHSIQGEGVWTGTNAYFIRLAGCDVGCSFCDTKVSWSPKPHPLRSLSHLLQDVQQVQPAIVVITGGEPLMHDLLPLTQSLRSLGMKVHLETSGAYPLSGEFDWVTLSPKRWKHPHPSIYPQVDELKVVVTQVEDLDWARDQARCIPCTAVKLLQPEWNTPTSQQWVLDFILRHPDWRLSLQTHKFLGVR